MPPFRIYYADGSTFDGDPFLAPALGVLVIVEADPEHGRRLVTGGDYYVWKEGRWWQADIFGFFQYMIQPGPRRALFGEQATNERYRDIYMRADSDKDFPTRTAWGPYEKRLTV